MAGCNLVIEAVFEDLAIKRQVFADLTLICSEATLLATNTSYLDPEEIVAGLPHPERFIAVSYTHLDVFKRSVKGDCSAGFRITELPVASAGPSFQAAIDIG